MLRHWILQFAFTPMLLPVLVGCSGSNGEPSQDVQVDNTRDSVGVEIIDCPDGLVFWPEHQGCAPRVDECEAWEVPVVGGGCMAVGPRGCPKLWDPNADVDCEPGELMDYDGAPCPEGFVLTEDEVACIPFFEEDGVCGELEIPVLGGGCQRVGPEWAVPDQPLFDECGDGLLALPGGGCVMIGPRGCPKTWNPDADVDCEVGDVLPCPEGWMESDDGMYCHPGWDECPHGEVPLTSGGCQRLLPEAKDCPSGPYPDPPGGATEILYVLAGSPCIEGCGTEAAPYPLIQDAIDAAKVGAAVLVGPGTYDEGLTLEKPVHVRGLCAALVEATGKALVLPDGDSKVLEAGVGIYDTFGIHLSGLRIRSPAAGVAIIGATNIALEDLDIAESHGVALYIDGGSDVEAGELWIHETETGSGEMGYGRGVWVGGGARLEAQAVLVEEVRMTGIEVEGEGTRLDLADGVIRKPNLDGSEASGAGIQASEGCTVLVVGSLLEENGEAGLAVKDSGTEVEVSGSVIRKTMPHGNGEHALGITAFLGCSVSVVGSLLEENRAGGLVVFDSGTKVEVSGSVIRKTMPTGNGEGGVGIGAFFGCSVSVVGSLLEENRAGGLQVAESGTEVEVSGSVIRKTMLDVTDGFGVGIAAFTGCSVSVVGSLLEKNWKGGLLVADSGTTVEVSASAFRTALPVEDVEIGMGIAATNGCTVSVADSLLEENREGGLLVSDSGTEVEVFGSVIRKTMRNTDGEHGEGIGAYRGCSVSVEGSLLEENWKVGLLLTDSSTEVDVSGSVIRMTLPNENGEFGQGVQASEGCSVSVVGSLLEENREAGLIVKDSGTEVEVSGSVIRRTMPNGNGGHALGIAAFLGCSVSVVGSLLEMNKEGGLGAFDSGTEVEVSASAFRMVLPIEDVEIGMGIQASLGSRVSVADSLVEENRLYGLIGLDPGTEVEVSGSVIQKTMPDGNGEFGYGISATDGCSFSVVGSVLEENRTTGLVAGALGTEVEVSGSLIRKTLRNDDGAFGVGLSVQEGASGAVSWCHIEGNSTAGIMAYGIALSAGLSRRSPSVLHVGHSAVLDTREGGGEITGGGYESFGDGVFAGGGSELHLDEVVVLGNKRTGVYYHESAGFLSNTVIIGNGSYGLAMQDSDQFLDLSNNFIFGNALDAVTGNPQGLPVPPVPEVLDADSLPL